MTSPLPFLTRGGWGGRFCMIYQFVVSFILGIGFEQFFHFGWSVGVLIFLVSLILFFYFRNESRPLEQGQSNGGPLEQKNQRRPFWDNSQRASLVFIIGIAFCFGVLRMSFVNNSPDSNLAKLVGQKISLEAVVSDEPDVRDTSARYTVSTNFNSLILLVADRFPELKYGDKISVSGKLELPKRFTNENGTEFDYVSYLSKDKIHFIIYRPQIKKIASDEGNKIISSLYSFKNIFIEKISNTVPEPNASLLGGLIFGAKQSLGRDLLDDFRKAGLIHIVVLSGYNITVIAAGIFYLTSFWGKRKLAFVVSVISITLFAFMVGLGATVIRASIMTLIAILARFLGRPADASRWLFVAGFLMLLWNPLILFYDPSFQLSFMATLGLILFSPPIFQLLSKIKTPIKGARTFVPKISSKNIFLEIISSTLAVQFFVLPLLVRMSGFISIISFIANPIILPLVPWAMAFGALTGALNIIPLVGGILSWPFGIISYLITQVTISLTELFANISFATISIGSLPLWVIFIWYAFYAFIYFKLKNSTPSQISTFANEKEEK